MNYKATKFKTGIFFAILLFGVSCNNDNPISSTNPPANLTSFNGSIENWNLGDTVMLYAISIYIDYPLSLLDSNDIYGTSSIGSNGAFTMTLKNPKISDSLFGSSYKLLFPSEQYSNYFISDTTARFQLSNFVFYSRNWVFVPFRIRNASRNVSSITDSLVVVGDYRCGSVYYYIDRDATIRYGGITVPLDTLSTDTFLEFKKGWNKIVTTVKVKRNKYIHLESRINNSFEGKYFIYHD